MFELQPTPLYTPAFSHCVCVCVCERERDRERERETERERFQVCVCVEMHTCVPSSAQCAHVHVRMVARV